MSIHELISLDAFCDDCKRSFGEVEKRTKVYVQRPIEYEIAGCPKCGNPDCDWSEYAHMCWCAKCEIDFIPEHGGIFDGPICVEVCRLLGIDLRQYDIATGKVEEL